MCEGNCKTCQNGKPDPLTSPQRRRFLGIAVGIINGVLGLAVLGPVVGFLASPLTRKTKGKWVPVIALNRIPDGETVEATFSIPIRDGYLDTVRKYSVFLSRNGDEVVCFDPACTHLGCRIKHQAAKKRFVCPCHGGVFDGQGNVVSGPPPKPLDRHQVKVEGGMVQVYKEV